MIEIINLENILPLGMLATLDEAVVSSVMRDVVDGARAYWIQIAGKALHSTKTEYIAGIQAVEWPNTTTAVITLTGVLPNLLENGMDAYDMHDTLLGPNVPVGPGGKHPNAKGGFYRAIPFRHQTPGQGAHGTPMGSAYTGMLGSAGAAQLGKDVYKAAKKLAPTLSDPYTGKTKWGGRLDTENLMSKGKQVVVPKLKSYHAVDIYKGMVRQEKSYGKATQSQYTTFRTISTDKSGKGTGSSPWIRPATPGKFLAKQVVDYVNRTAPMAFQAYVNGLKP
jgi:hypothetical protein